MKKEKNRSDKERKTGEELNTIIESMIVGIGDKRFIELFEIERIHLARIIIIIKKEFWFAKSAPLVRDEIEIKRRFLGLVPRNQCKSYERVSWTYIDISLVHIWTLVRASAIFSCNKQIRDWQQHRDRTWNLCAALKILQKSNYVFGIYIYMRMILKFFSDKIVRFKEEKKKRDEKIKKKNRFFKIISIYKYYKLSSFQRLEIWYRKCMIYYSAVRKRFEAGFRDQ